MDSSGLTLALAFGAGLLSFVSPCVLPLVPAYLGHLSGAAGQTTGGGRGRVLAHAVLFVLGFSAVFVALWTSIGLIGNVVPAFLPLFRQVGGIVLVAMGLHLTGVLKIPLLYRERRFQLGAGHSPSLPLSFLVGVIFAAGWTPCIGPVLAGIIGLATLSETVLRGTVLLVAYAAGLGVPFLLAAASLEGLIGVTRRIRAHYGLVEAVSGVFLIAVGVLMLTNMFVRLPQYFYFGAA